MHFPSFSPRFSAPPAPFQIARDFGLAEDKPRAPRAPGGGGGGSKPRKSAAHVALPREAALAAARARLAAVALPLKLACGVEVTR